MDDEEIYTVVVPGYLVQGGGGYDVLKKNVIEHSTSGQFLAYSIVFIEVFIS
jgi:hypothetical protein